MTTNPERYAVRHRQITKRAEADFVHHALGRRQPRVHCGKQSDHPANITTIVKLLIARSQSTALGL
jgi:hypothetical protein